MKKILSILLLCFCFSSYAQYDNSILEVEDFSFNYLSSSNNMSVVFPELSLIEFENHYIMAFVNNNPVSFSFQITNGQAGLPVCGLDGFEDYPWWASDGDIVEFYILVDSTIVQVEINPQVIFYPGAGYSLWGGSDCMYNYQDGVSCNFNFHINGEIVNFGCTDSNYNEYQSNANLDDGTCMTLGVLGCMNPDALNFDNTASINDEQSCIFSHEYVHGLWNQIDDGTIEYEYLQDEYNTLNYNFDSLQYVADYLSTQVFDLQQELIVPNIEVDMAIGWNMIGFSCPEEKGATDALIDIVDEILIMKDNNGSVYMPEYGFNGIGDLTPGHGYQLKVTDYILDFNICE